MLTSYPPARTRGAVIARSTFSQRRRRRLGRTIGVALLLVAVIATAVYLWLRPVDVAVAASPSDATITVAGKTAAGLFTLDGVKPGAYPVTVTRTGYEPRAFTLQAKHLKGAEVKVVLVPLPQPLKVSSIPGNARIIAVRGDKEVAGAKGSLACTLPSGPVMVKISSKGYNEFSRDLMLDGEQSLSIRLDPKGQLVHALALSKTAGAPKGVAVTPDGSQAWTSILDGPPSIQIFEPASGKNLGGVDLGTHGAVEVIFSKDGSRAYASQMETARVFEIDVRTRKVLRSFDTESAWTKVVALSPDEKTLYAANWSGDDVSEIDLTSGKLRRRIRVADTPRGLWPTADGKTLWVASFGTGDLERVDLKSGKVKRVFTSGGALRHLVADEKRGRLYASDMARDCVWVTDMKSGKTTKFVTVDKKPNTIDLSPDGRVLFVSCRGENNAVSYYLPGPEWGSILLYDALKAKPLDAVIGGNQCTALDVSTDGGLLVFSDFLDNRLRSYEVPDFKTLAEGKGGRFAAHKRDLVKQ